MKDNIGKLLLFSNYLLIVIYVTIKFMTRIDSHSNCYALTTEIDVITRVRT